MNPPKDLTSEEERIREIVAAVVSRYSTRNLIAIIVAAFAAGSWAAKVQWDLNASRQGLAEERASTMERVREWSLWRAHASTKINETRWIVDNHETRLTTLEKK